MVAFAVTSFFSAPVVHADQEDVRAQYRAWMEEARMQYPYSEPLTKMWSVMMCESSGNPQASGARGRYLGLFQYARGTWNGSWNPYRDQSIFDPKAQIFATAKAWHDGHQRWWGCYKRR